MARSLRTRPHLSRTILSLTKEAKSFVGAVRVITMQQMPIPLDCTSSVPCAILSVPTLHGILFLVGC